MSRTHIGMKRGDSNGQDDADNQFQQAGFNAFKVAREKAPYSGDLPTHHHGTENIFFGQRPGERLGGVLR